MGEIADQICSGFLDEETLEMIDGDAPGYPRSPERDKRHRGARHSRCTREKLYECKVCGKRFKTAASLQQHVAAKHGREEP